MLNKFSTTKILVKYRILYEFLTPFISDNPQIMNFYPTNSSIIMQTIGTV